MTDRPTIAEALRTAREYLSASSDSAQLDAEVLLAHTLDKPASYLFAWPENALTEKQTRDFNRLVEKRAGGQPIAYLTGVREFWSLELKVTADTLIPRPETELLVEFAVDAIRKTGAGKVLDLGTGSGAIALAIANEYPATTVYACDNSPAALAVAKENAARLNLVNAQFFHSDWYENLPPRTFDIIVSNPPYIEEDDPHLQRGDVAFEPRSALASGGDGLNAIRTIAQRAPGFLVDGGSLAFEHGFNQGKAVRRILADNGFQNPYTQQDLQGLDRISFATRPTATG